MWWAERVDVSGVWGVARHTQCVGPSLNVTGCVLVMSTVVVLADQAVAVAAAGQEAASLEQTVSFGVLCFPLSGAPTPLAPRNTHR